MAGDFILLSRNNCKNPLQEYECEGVVRETVPNFVVELSWIPASLYDATWRIDKSANRTTLDRLLHTLQLFCTQVIFSELYCYLLVLERVKNAVRYIQ